MACLLGLALLAVFAWRFLHIADALQAQTTAALRAQLEPTAHPHKGLAAYLLSDIEEAIEMAPAFSDTSRGFSHWFTRVQAAIDETHLTNLDPKVDLSLKQTIRSNEQDYLVGRQFLAATHSAAYIYVPATTLRRASVDHPPLEKDTDILEALRHNPEVLFDVNVAYELGNVFEMLARGDLTIGGRPFVQMYFITQSGVLAINSRLTDDQEAHYRDQFSGHAFFPERPYFWAAVDAADFGTPSLDIWDYRTQPYLDLGGNGVIVTYVKAFKLPRNRAAVLCFDISLPEDAIDEVRRRLRALMGDSEEFVWPRDPAPSGFQWFVGQVADSGRQRSRILGQIAVEDAAEAETLRFTLPLASLQIGETRHTRMLAGTIDLGRLQSRQLLYLSLASIGAVIVSLFFVNFVWAYWLQQDEVQKVLPKVARIMRDAPVAFAWTDEANAFRGANACFLELVGYSSLEELRRHVPRLMDMVEEGSLDVYQEQLEKGLRGETTSKPYTVSLIRKDRKLVTATVFAESVAVPSLFRRPRVPHRFGILRNTIVQGDEPVSAS